MADSPTPDADTPTPTPTPDADTPTPTPGFVSNWLKFSDHSRLHISRCAGSRRIDNRVFVTDHDGELAMLLTFESASGAERELILIAEQVDRLEAYNAAKEASAAKAASAALRSGRR